jgi:hypothetical protein
MTTLAPKTRVTCIDASQQPLLQQGALYEIVADIHSARTTRTETASGYVVRGALHTNALPCVFRRSRFSPAPATQPTEE